MPTSLSARTTSCAGCLDSRQCWVCDGDGATTARGGAVVRCSRCAGRGLCAVCRPAPQERTAC